LQQRLAGVWLRLLKGQSPLHLPVNESTLQENIHTLFLPSGEAVVVRHTEDHQLELVGRNDNLWLHGAYAEGLVRQLGGQPDAADRTRARLIERQHPWLAGLAEASSKPPHGLRPLLIGKEFGTLFIELTARCNERCIHCYAESMPERNEFLAADEVAAVLEETRKLGRPFIQFTGGDPLIHRDLVAIVAHAHHLDFEGIEIYTNGLLLHDRLLEQLAPFSPRMAFSIYADTPEVHDAITRTAGSWQRTLDAMLRAQQAGLSIRAGVVVMQENIACIERMNDFLRERVGLTPSFIHYDAVNAVGRAQLQTLSADIEIVPSHAPTNGSPHRGKLCLAANGDIYPCIFARNIRLGNIHEMPLPRILATLDKRKPATPSEERWRACVERLSCPDCRIAAYTIGESAS